MTKYLLLSRTCQNRSISIPTRKQITSSDVIIPLSGHVFSKHGMYCKFISDRNSLLASKYFQEIMDIISIKKNTASKGHPQTHGQREISISTLSQMFRHVILRNPKEQDFQLKGLQFELNTAVDKNTELVPFEVDSGILPKSQLMRKTGLKSQFEAAINILERRKMSKSIARDNQGSTEAQKFTTLI